MEKRISSFNPLSENGENKLNIEAISIISSCGCNLKCSYCVIAQSENHNTAQLQKATVQALQDGSFLQNTVNSLLALNQSPAKIRMFSLWGQEPTLTLQHVAEHWDEWYKAFPNIQKIFFSTNGMEFGGKILDFIKVIDKHATTNISIQVQISYDGDYGTDNIRNANGKQIEQNITNLILELNNYRLNKADVMFCFHGVMSQALIDTLTSGKMTQDYFNNASDWVYRLADVNENKKVRVEPGVGFTLESPIDATIEQGIDLATFYKKMIKINPKYVNNLMGNIEASSILAAYQRAFRGIKYCNYPSFTEMIYNITQDENHMKRFLEFFSHSSYCGTYYGELKIMYDGRIIGCQNSMYEQTTDVIKNDGSIKNGAKLSLAQHKTFFVNPLTDDSEHIHKVFNIFRENRESSFLFAYTSTINTMLWMLEAHQIDESYQDLEKLMAHAFYLTLLNACIYNNYIQTGSFYGMATGTIRYFCNGFLDCVFEDYDAWGGMRYDDVPRQ